MIRSNHQKEFLFDLIQELPSEAQKIHMTKLRELILKEEEQETTKVVEPFSISNLLNNYPINSSIRQNKNNELYKEINNLKLQIKKLKNDLETKYLKLET